jgi:hypothetical protein
MSANKLYVRYALAMTLILVVVAAIIAGPMLVPVRAAARQVTISNGHLYVNGQPYEIEGIAYQPYEIGNNLPDPTAPQYDVPKIAALGANTIRTYHSSLWVDSWGTVYDLRDWTDALLPVAEANGLMVIVGMWADTNPGTDWNNASHRATWTANWQDMITRFKNYPAVLMWSIGNEQIHVVPDNQRVAYAQWIESMIQWAHTNDPNHPVMYADYETSAKDTIINYIPSLDVYAIQSYVYPSVANYNQTVASADDVGVPILFSEWGADYYDRKSGSDQLQIKATWDRLIFKAITTAGPNSASGYIGHSFFEFDNDQHKVQSWAGQDWGGYSGGSLICGCADCRDDQEHWGITGAVVEGGAASRATIPIVYDNIRDLYTNGLGSDTTAPGQVTGLTASGSGAYTVTLGWNAVSASDLSFYLVYRGESSGFSLTKPDNPGFIRTWTMLAAVPANSTSYVDNNDNGLGPKPGTTYYYRVAAVDKSGNEGTASSAAGGSTSGSTPNPSTTMIVFESKMLLQDCYTAKNVLAPCQMSHYKRMPANFYGMVNVRDLNLNPVSGAAVTAQVIGGDGAVKYTINATTDADGRAWFTKAPMNGVASGQCYFRVTSVTKSGMTSDLNMGYGVQIRFWIGETGPAATPTPTSAGPTNTPTPAGPTATPTTPPPPTNTPTPGVMHVSNIAMSSQKVGKNYKAVATVTIVDASDQPVGTATVYGEFTGATSDSVSGNTDGSGNVALSSSNKSGGGSWTFCVTNVTRSGWTYNSSANVETCDSITAP